MLAWLADREEERKREVIEEGEKLESEQERDIRGESRKGKKRGERIRRKVRKRAEEGY